MVMNFMMGEVETNYGSVGVGTEELFTLELNLIYVHSSVDNEGAKNTRQTEINENTLLRAERVASLSLRNVSNIDKQGVFLGLISTYTY